MPDPEIISAKAGIVGMLTLAAAGIADFMKRRNSTKAMGTEIKGLRKTTDDNHIALIQITATMVTKDDMTTMTEKFSAIQREQAKLLTDALQAGLQHAHERIDTLFQK